ncbi:alpha/beta hydrolase [Actinocorallia longicatena]|uniref:BD-FAE-like domain-containing protein n=1 Tax=Actinocorallia longicatena TaxID=111803 RepID=A0ABP6QH08_9ACTN
MNYRDILVAETYGYRPLFMNLATPPGAYDAPVLVWIHGGAWLGGSPALRPGWLGSTDLVAEAVAAGFAVASVTYRMSAEAVFPAQLDDVSAAVEWIRENAAGHGLDASRISVWGESAGGHLAAMLALTDPGIRSAVLWYAPANLLTKQDHHLAGAHLHSDPAHTPESLLIGGNVHDHQAEAMAASPVAHVSPGAPPVLLMHGEADRVVPCEQSVELYEALRSAGASPELRLVPGADHCWEGGDVAALVADSLDFFGKNG